MAAATVPRETEAAVATEQADSPSTGLPPPTELTLEGSYSKNIPKLDASYSFMKERVASDSVNANRLTDDLVIHDWPQDDTDVLQNPHH